MDCRGWRRWKNWNCGSQALIDGAASRALSYPSVILRLSGKIPLGERDHMMVNAIEIDRRVEIT